MTQIEYALELFLLENFALGHGSQPSKVARTAGQRAERRNVRDAWLAEEENTALFYLKKSHSC